MAPVIAAFVSLFHFLQVSVGLSSSSATAGYFRNYYLNQPNNKTSSSIKDTTSRKMRLATSQILVTGYFFLGLEKLKYCCEQTIRTSLRTVWYASIVWARRRYRGGIRGNRGGYTRCIRSRISRTFTLASFAFRRGSLSCLGAASVRSTRASRFAFASLSLAHSLGSTTISGGGTLAF